MEYVRCANGHFFDKNTFITCPNCGAGPSDSSKAPAQKKEKGLFSMFKSKADKAAPAKPAAPISSNETMSMYSNESSEPPMSNTPVENQVQTEGDNKQSAYGLWETNTYSQAIEKKNVEQYREPDVVPEPVAERISNPTPAPVTTPEPAANTSIQDQLKQATGNEGKTFGYFSLNKSESAAPTTSSVTSAAVPNEPVVGWLVCTKGPAFGQCFNIYCGRNSVGRSTNNRIAIVGDNSISREKHAIIMYEPKKREFWMQPSDSNSLAYCNGDVIMSPIKIGKKSEIELGNTKLLLIPLCDEDFSWDDFAE